MDDSMHSYLAANQLSGTIRASIGSLIGLQYLYGNHLSVAPWLTPVEDSIFYTPKSKTRIDLLAPVAR